jgi:hypothetical protein
MSAVIPTLQQIAATVSRCCIRWVIVGAAKDKHCATSNSNEYFTEIRSHQTILPLYVLKGLYNEFAPLQALDFF